MPYFTHHLARLRARTPWLRVASVLVVSMSGVLLQAHGETLENLQGSKAMQDFKVSEIVQGRSSKRRTPVEAQWLRGIDPGSNLGSIWGSGNSPQTLLNWAGSKLPFIQYRRPHGARSKDFVTAEVELTDSDRINSRLTIMVPHPSIAPLVEANVLEEFRKLRPPALEVVGEKKIPLTVGEGTLYEHKKGSASLLIPIAQNGIINLSTLHYKDAQSLIEIAKGLDIERLNRKLDS